MPKRAPRPGDQDGEGPDARTGEDIRRRGWYWHWNSIITQYAPLIGLKGVGLLNSYTVWTDRREDSPHRGYAFPSQQAEATFYGEDRAELITINKILVALDLIEVRKEMVLHVDDKGRRWRVPHNLYRVKDSPNGFNLTVEDVLRVADLAAKTTAVYRYIRRVFSSNFAPIDSKNPWHEILPAVRQTETWQKLAARAEREDARASARSKAGHRKRKGKGDTSQHSDSSSAEESRGKTAQEPDRQTSVADDNNGANTNVPESNNGFHADVEMSNRAFAPKSPTSDEQANEGEETIVHPGNTTYNQEFVNTTRTTTRDHDESLATENTQPRTPPPGANGSGPVLQGSPAVLVAFEAANDRSATGLERELLGELERDFSKAAEQASSTPSDWVVEAIREAVNSGSRFVAPKRVREILSRWSSTSGRSVRPRRAKTSVIDQKTTPNSRDTVHSAWLRVFSDLSRSSEWPAMAAALEGAEFLGEGNGVVTLSLSDSELDESEVRHICHAIEPRLRDELGRSVRVEFVPATYPSMITRSLHAPREGEDGAGKSPAPAQSHPPAQSVPRFPVVGGLTNGQVWAAAQAELQSRISSANFETWLRPAALIGRDEDGCLVLGVPNRFAQQRVQAKLRTEIASVLSHIIGSPVELRIVVTQQWLREQEGAD